MPFGENVTQGSDARWKSPPFAAFPPAQMLKCAHDSAHVAPPSKDVEVTNPCEPPFDQRSCWKAPTMWSGSAGSTATRGSTSAFSYNVPDCGTPSQPAGNGLGFDATDGAVAVNTPEAAAPTTTAAARTAIATTILLMNTPLLVGSKTGCASRPALSRKRGAAYVAHDVG